MKTERPYLSILNPNEGKYGAEKLRIWTLFTQSFKKATFQLLNKNLNFVPTSKVNKKHKLNEEIQIF